MGELLLNISLLCDNQAESGVISTLIYHPEMILNSEFLKAGHFYNVENGCIYWAIDQLYKKGVDNIDAFNLTNMLNSNDAVKKTVEKFNIGNMQELIDLSKHVARDSLEEYKLVVNKVITLAFKRDLYKKLQEFERNCFDDKLSLGELNSNVYEGLNKLTEQYVLTNDVKTFSEKADELWEEILKRRTGNKIYGIPSKFPIINEYFTYEPQELVLLEARMKQGKSCWMMQELIHKIKNGIPVGYLDSEMDSRLFFERLLSSLTKIEVKRIKNGDYSSSEEQKLLEAKEWLKKQNFSHIYQPQWSMDQVYSVSKILQHKIGMQFLIFDYVKSNTRNSSEQYNEIGAMVDHLKNNIAGGLKIPVLTAIQLNRQGEVADSDKAERYASVAIKWREKTQEEIITNGSNCGNYALSIKLNRLGEQMPQDHYLDFYFNGNTMTIEQAKEQHKIEELPI